VAQQFPGFSVSQFAYEEAIHDVTHLLAKLSLIVGHGGSAGFPIGYLLLKPNL
jgi:hypothetical protein